jgi:hypothetical protein
MTPSEKDQHRLRMLEHLSRTAGQAPPAPAVGRHLPIRLIGPVRQTTLRVRTDSFRRQERSRNTMEQLGLSGL